MLALRVSASDLDAFRYFRDNEDAELADLLAQLRRESAPTPAMIAGTAFHAALEAGEIGEHEALTAEGHTFTLALDAEIDLPPVREMKATADFQIGDVLVTLVGKVDAVHGRRVYDHKLTGRYDPERFMGSFQWRVYLTVFDADEFRWNIFEARETDERTYVVHALHVLRMHRYPTMQDDLERELSTFVDFARRHLPERVRGLA